MTKPKILSLGELNELTNAMVAASKIPVPGVAEGMRLHIEAIDELLWRRGNYPDTILPEDILQLRSAARSKELPGILDRIAIVDACDTALGYRFTPEQRREAREYLCAVIDRIGEAMLTASPVEGTVH